MGDDIQVSRCLQGFALADNFQRVKAERQFEADECVSVHRHQLQRKRTLGRRIRPNIRFKSLHARDLQ